jgi:hypothetical protein
VPYGNLAAFNPARRLCRVLWGAFAAAWEVQMAQLLVFGVDSPQTAEALHRDHPVGSTDPSAS